MALVVEDGTGKADAESFATVAEADTRLAALGMTIWDPLADEEKEQSLRRATIHMENVYRALWKGTRKTSTQALSWPRYDVIVEAFDVSNEFVPIEVRNACIDLAFRAAAGDLNPDLGGDYPVKKKKVGPIEKEFDTSGSQVKSYRAVTMGLSPYLNVSNGRVIR